MKLRGYLALVVICTSFIVLDLVQRTVIALGVRLRPERRVAILGSWIQSMAAWVMGTLSRVAGARLPPPERVVPSGPGVLIVMNHQSLLDIPLVVETVDGGYPRIVTRARYHRFIPLISHMVRLYQYPVVDPSAKPREVVRSLARLQETARDSEVPIAIFPEGTRTRDGEIGRFKRRGLYQILAARDWTVHVLVVDGFWQTRRFVDFIGGLHHIDGRRVHMGTLRWDDPDADPGPFVERIRAMMNEGLRALREGAVPA